VADVEVAKVNRNGLVVPQMPIAHVMIDRHIMAECWMTFIPVALHLDRFPGRVWTVMADAVIDLEIYLQIDHVSSNQDVLYSLLSIDDLFKHSASPLLMCYVPDTRFQGQYVLCSRHEIPLYCQRTKQS